LLEKLSEALSSFALHQGNPKYYEEGQAMVNRGKLSSLGKSETEKVCKQLHWIASNFISCCKIVTLRLHSL